MQIQDCCGKPYKKVFMWSLCSKQRQCQRKNVITNYTDAAVVTVMLANIHYIAAALNETFPSEKLMKSKRMMMMRGYGATWDRFRSEQATVYVLYVVVSCCCACIYV